MPLYGLLLLGGQVAVNHVAGGLNVASSGNTIKLKAWPRIGILVNQLRCASMFFTAPNRHH